MAEKALNFFQEHGIMNAGRTPYRVSPVVNEHSCFVLIQFLFGMCGGFPAIDNIYPKIACFNGAPIWYLNCIILSVEIKGKTEVRRTC